MPNTLYSGYGWTRKPGYQLYQEKKSEEMNVMATGDVTAT